MPGQRAHSLDGIDAFIERAMAEWHIPGLAIAVVQTDDPAVLKTFGWRDRDVGWTGGPCSSATATRARSSA